MRRRRVQAEGQAAGRQLLELQLEVVEVGPQRRPAVDDEEDVAVPVVGAALGAPPAVGLDGVDALLAEVGLAPVDDAVHLGDDPAYDVGLGAGADAGDVRQPASGANVPPPKSSTKNCDSCGVVVSDKLVTIVRSSVLLPLRGPPTTAT